MAFQYAHPELIYRLLNMMHLSSHLLPLFRECKCDHAAICGGGRSFDESCLDKPVDQAPGAADLTGKQFTKRDQG